MASTNEGTWSFNPYLQKQNSEPFELKLDHSRKVRDFFQKPGITGALRTPIICLVLLIYWRHTRFYLISMLCHYVKTIQNKNSSLTVNMRTSVPIKINKYLYIRFQVKKRENCEPQDHLSEEANFLNSKVSYRYLGYSKQTNKHVDR